MAPPRVFISYSRADLLFVLRLSHSLRAAGAQTWVDVEDLRPGESWKDAIETAMRGAAVFLLVVSRKCLESQWTGVELRLAQSLGLPILPVVIEDLDPRTLPASLQDLHMLSLANAPCAALESAAVEAAFALLGLAPLVTPQPSQRAERAWIELRGPEPEMGSPEAAWFEMARTLRPATHSAVALDCPPSQARTHALLAQSAGFVSAELLLCSAAAVPVALFLLGALVPTLGAHRVQIVTNAACLPALEPVADLARASCRVIDLKQTGRVHLWRGQAS
jgi:hypothetical protein